MTFRAISRFGAVLVAVLIAAPGLALAQSGGRYASFVIDTDTNRVLHSRNADELRYPASLTKMMTLYLLFDAIEAGEVGLNDQMPISELAAAQEPSKIYVRAGATLRVEDAILALSVRSANDVAVVLGEYLGGSVENFALMMTEKARELGMTRTRFRNPHGLPDEGQITTARDMARLGAALFENHPGYYHYFHAEEFRYGNVTYRSHNRLLANMDGVTGVDGIKTGYIRASGYNLATSAERDGRRIVAVVMGGSTSRIRDAHMADLVEQAFVALADGGEEPFLVATLTPDGLPISHIVGAPIPPDHETMLANRQEQARAFAFAMTRPAEHGDARSDRGVRIVLSDTAGAPAPEERARAQEPAQTGDSDTPPPATFRTPIQPAPPPEDRREAALRTVLRDDNDAFGLGWQIQVGAYRDQETALSRLAQLEEMALSVLAGAARRVENATLEEGAWYRARFYGLTETAAREACSVLAAQGDGCFPVRP